MEKSCEEIFESAVNTVRSMPKNGPFKPSDETKLKLYAFYKQATHGFNCTPRPRFYDLVNIYKWNAWKKLGSMSKDDAKLAYIQELKNIVQSKLIDGKQCPQELIDIMGPFYEFCQSDNPSVVKTKQDQNQSVTNDKRYEMKENLIKGLNNNKITYDDGPVSSSNPDEYKSGVVKGSDKSINGPNTIASKIDAKTNGTSRQQSDFRLSRYANNCYVTS